MKIKKKAVLPKRTAKQKRIESSKEKSFMSLEKIRDICNSGKEVKFIKDFGGNTLTVFIGNEHHHIGTIDGDLEKMINSLFRTLTK